MWLKLRVEERGDFTQRKTIRTEKKRETEKERGVSGGRYCKNGNSSILASKARLPSGDRCVERKDQALLFYFCKSNRLLLVDFT